MTVIRPDESKKSPEDRRKEALEDWRQSIITRSEAVDTINRAAEFLIEKGYVVRGTAVLRSIEILTGEPYRPPTSREGVEVAQGKKPNEPQI